MKSKTKNTLQIIYTFAENYQGKTQMVANFEYRVAALETKESFVAFATEALKAHLSFEQDIQTWFDSQHNAHRVEEMPELRKLSGCVYSEKELSFPEWWSKSSGKVYFED